MVKISVHGFYGMGNLGDEAILKSLLDESNHYDNLEYVVFSRNPEKVSQLYGLRAISSYKRGDFLKRRSEIKSSNLFILGGGGLLKDYGDTTASLQGWLRLLLVAQKLRVKTAVYAIGAENIRYQESKAALRNALAKVDLITVRDNNSKEILESVGVKNEIKVYTDPAVLLTPSKGSFKRKLKKPIRVAICIRHWFSKGNYIENTKANENFKKEMGRALDYLVENYTASLDFIPMRTSTPDDDRKVAAEIKSFMKNKDSINIQTTVPGVDEFIKILDNYSLLLGMRLHSLILGAASGIPVIGLSYMPKVTAFMKSINETEHSLELKSITTERIIDSMEKTIQNYGTRSEHILSEISNLQKKAKKNIDELIYLTK